MLFNKSSVWTKYIYTHTLHFTLPISLSCCFMSGDSVAFCSVLYFKPKGR